MKAPPESIPQTDDCLAVTILAPLGAEADQASDEDTRRTLVDRIASLTVEYQAENSD
jgi:hypothetical protein